MIDKTGELTDLGRAALKMADWTPGFYLLRLETSGDFAKSAYPVFWMNDPEQTGIRLSYSIVLPPCAAAASPATH